MLLIKDASEPTQQAAARGNIKGPTPWAFKYSKRQGFRSKDYIVNAGMCLQRVMHPSWT